MLASRTRNAFDMDKQFLCHHQSAGWLRLFRMTGQFLQHCDGASAPEWKPEMLT